MNSSFTFFFFFGLGLALILGCTDSAAETDRDKDGIMDVSDACPDVAESPNRIDDLDGCPEPETYTAPTANPALEGRGGHLESPVMSVPTAEYPAPPVEVAPVSK